MESFNKIRINFRRSEDHYAGRTKYKNKKRNRSLNNLGQISNLDNLLFI